MPPLYSNATREAIKESERREKRVEKENLRTKDIQWAHLREPRAHDI